MYGIKVIVKGDYACFTRPEMKVERVSYDVPTPSACRGILDCIYWKPAIRWVIDRIVVYEPIRFFQIRRNEVTKKVSAAAANKLIKLETIKDPEAAKDFKAFSYEINQRASTVLRDVRYGIEAHFEMTPDAGEDETEAKHADIMRRRLTKGECFRQPVLGCREFTCSFEVVDALPESPLHGDVDLNYMLYDMQYRTRGNKTYDNFATPIFYRPHMIDGVIDVRRYREEQLC